MSKLIYGVGTNDTDYVVQPTINGKRVWCPFYRAWQNMLTRCYCETRLKRYPTYQGCTVCKEWLLFSNFKMWMEKQDWQGKHLDKDLVGDGEVYSPGNCCFVESWLNLLFNDHGRAQGKWPVGVYYNKQDQKFKAQLTANSTRTYLGSFDTPKAAHLVYLKAKREYVIDKMKHYPDQRIKEAVLAKVEGAAYISHHITSSVK